MARMTRIREETGFGFLSVPSVPSVVWTHHSCHSFDSWFPWQEDNMQAAPQNPAGEFVPEENPTSEGRAQLIDDIEKAPATLRQIVAGLSDKQLDTRYRNRPIRQIVHHIADS